MSFFYRMYYALAFSDAKKNFKKAELKWSDFDIPYDYDSIMHSSVYAGAVHDHVKTIILLKKVLVL